MQTDNWDRKLIIECVSKGINSVLMQKPDIDLEKLESIGEFLIVFYVSKMEALKAMEGDPIIEEENFVQKDIKTRKALHGKDWQHYSARPSTAEEREKVVKDKIKQTEELKTIPTIEE